MVKSKSQKWGKFGSLMIIEALLAFIDENLTFEACSHSPCREKKKSFFSTLRMKIFQHNQFFSVSVVFRAGFFFSKHFIRGWYFAFLDFLAGDQFFNLIFLIFVIYVWPLFQSFQKNPLKNYLKNNGKQTNISSCCYLEIIQAVVSQLTFACQSLPLLNRFLQAPLIRRMLYNMWHAW